MLMKNDWEIYYENLSLEYAVFPTVLHMNLTQLKIALHLGPLLLAKVFLLSWDRGKWEPPPWVHVPLQTVRISFSANPTFNFYLWILVLWLLLWESIFHLLNFSWKLLHVLIRIIKQTGSPVHGAVAEREWATRGINKIFWVAKALSQFKSAG